MIYALIPARSGSKSVKNKNIRLMNGKPLLAYSIEVALKSKLIDRVIVSTDSEEYASIAKAYGAEVPFLRPADISNDTALDVEVFEHFLDWLKEQGEPIPEAIVHLRPTHPIREVGDIDAMIQILKNNPSAESVRSLSLAKQTPYKMWLFAGDSKIKPVVGCDIEEAYNAPRQILPKAYMQNACIDIVRSGTIIDKHSMTGDNILGYKMEYDYDIDTETEFTVVEQIMLLREILQSKKKMKIVCDIDGVIANKTKGNDYSIATPIVPNIKLINNLYEQGHEIVLFTARGYKTGIDWLEITKKQMLNWGVCHNQLVFGKPDADFYIDDKLIGIDALSEVIKNV